MCNRIHAPVQNYICSCVEHKPIKYINSTWLMIIVCTVHVPDVYMSWLLKIP